MRVLVVSGSSGGHIFPALAFLDALKEKDKFGESLLVLPLRSLDTAIEISGQRVKYINIASPQLRLDYRNLRSLLNCVRAVFESLCIILKFKPDIVVGFGSIATFPMIFLAWFLRIKTLIHEQNVNLGRANRLLVKFCDQVALSFTETSKYLKGSRDKTIVTGNPLRKDLIILDKARALDFLGLKNNCFTLLVMGGSLASHSINIAFCGILSRLIEDSPIQVIHLCGKDDYEYLNSQYSKLGVNFALAPFLKQMQYAYSSSDLVISRAGATTIAELIFFKLPAIIVPYPYAARHQQANARALEEKGCAFVIEDNELDSPKLLEALKKLIQDRQALEAMRSGYDSFKSGNANELLVQAVLSMINFH